MAGQERGGAEPTSEPKNGCHALCSLGLALFKVKRMRLLSRRLEVTSIQIEKACEILTQRRAAPLGCVQQ